MNETGRRDPRRALPAWRIAAALIALLLAKGAYAQVATGTILGNVKDTSGAAVPTAIVTATNLGTQFARSTTTDSAGQYALRLLPVGQYKLEVSLTGFKGFTQTGIALEVGRNARVDAVIEPGGVTEVVSVVADAPLVETNSSSLSRTVGQNEVLNLPLVNRDLYSLLSLTGGVTSNENSNSLGGPEQLTTINGSQRAQIGSVNFQLDGGNNTAGLRGTGNPAPNPEAIQEFRVITNNYAAEYGRYPAGVVDIVTKSGTNDFHGAAFEFFRNESLNAKRWVPPGAATSAKDPLDRNQYGAAIGGPLRKDKTFFFASFSGLRQTETYYRNTAVVPTSRERLGDFSQSASKPRDPVTNLPFAGGIIPTSRLDPAALAIQDKYVPQSNLPNNFFEVSRPDPLSTDEATLKLDHNFKATHSIALSYFYQKGTDTQPLSLTGNIPWVDRDFKWTQHNLNLADTWTLSSTTINQLRFTYVRQFGGRVNNPTTSLGDLNSKFKIQGDPTLPRLTVSGFFTGQTSIAGPDAGSDYWAVRDALSISRGKHSFKFGGEVSYEKIVHDTLLDNYGVFAFNGSKSGNAYADFLLGLPSTFTQDAPIRKTDNGAYLSAFAQDDFRVHPRADLEPRDPLRRAVPVHRSAGPQAGLRSGREVAGLAHRPGRPPLPRRSGDQPRHRPHRLEQHRPAPGPGLGPQGRRAHLDPSRLRLLLRQHQRQRVEHDRGQPALHRPPALPDGQDVVRSLREPARRRGSVPVRVQPREPAVHAARGRLRPLARLRVAVHLPDEPHGREGAAARLQRERVLRGRSRPQSARAASTGTTRCSAPAPPPRTSTRAAPTSPGPSDRPACWSPPSPATITPCSSAPSGAAPTSRARPTTRSARPSRTSTTRAAACPRSRTRTASSSSARARPPIAPTASCSPASGGSITSRIPGERPRPC